MNWDSFFLNIAIAVSKKSNCFSVQYGAVIVKDKTIIATGYNGPPRGVPHCEERLSDWLQDGTVNQERAKNNLSIIQTKEKITLLNCPRRIMGYESGKGLEWCAAAHAEINAIANASRLGIELKDSVMYCNFGIPCRECAKSIINAGISEVIVTKLKEYHDEGIKSLDLLSQGNVFVRLYEN